MKNNFNNVFKELKNESKKNGKRSFNKTKFDEFALAMLNSDVTTEVVKSRTDSDTTTVDVEVTKDFINGTIKPILKDFGIDNIEAETINNYEFKKVDGMYEFISELIYQWMETDKPFKFLPKEDFNGTLLLIDKDKCVKERKNTRSNDNTETVTYEYDSHKVIKSKSSTPKNKRKKIK
ncbi:MAG TPA: hypothetical protein DCE23_01370 [Firmicutes bacterium]|nr:hypothetical protein [Bacillota bacterium]